MRSRLAARQFAAGLPQLPPLMTPEVEPEPEPVSPELAAPEEPDLLAALTAPDDASPLGDLSLDDIISKTEAPPTAEKPPARRRG